MSTSNTVMDHSLLTRMGSPGLLVAGKLTGETNSDDLSITPRESPAGKDLSFVRRSRCWRILQQCGCERLHRFAFFAQDLELDSRWPQLNLSRCWARPRLLIARLQ